MFSFHRSHRTISTALACSLLLAQLNVSAVAACSRTTSPDSGGSQCKCGTGMCGMDTCCCSRPKAAQAQQTTSASRSCCKPASTPGHKVPVEATSAVAIDAAPTGNCHCRARVPAPLDAPRRSVQSDSIRLLASVLSHESAVAVEEFFYSFWPADSPGSRHSPVSVQQLHCCWLV